jgi:hypothetical protein
MDSLKFVDPLIIKAAWGPRVTSSKTRGMNLQAYPDKVGAGKGLWIAWISRKKDYVSVVIAKKKAQARIDAAIGIKHDDPEMAQAEPLAPITQEEIDDMLAEREELRASKDFEGADKIRDYLLKQGVIFSDKKIK